jgi:hypothetical protein
MWTDVKPNVHRWGEILFTVEHYLLQPTEIRSQNESRRATHHRYRAFQEESLGPWLESAGDLCFPSQAFLLHWQLSMRAVYTCTIEITQSPLSASICTVELIARKEAEEELEAYEYESNSAQDDVQLQPVMLTTRHKEKQ